MATRRQFLALVGSGTLVAGGVAVGVSRLPAGTRTATDGMPAIQYGREHCSYCTMSIDDPRFAAAWRTPAGRERHFDDIGCMVNALRSADPPSGTRYWVHDYRNEGWLDADTATYVVASSIKTPMAYGVAAFADAADAEAAIPSARATLAWANVLGTLERKG